MVHWVLFSWFLLILIGVADLVVLGVLLYAQRSRSLGLLLALMTTTVLELLSSLLVQYSIVQWGHGHPTVVVADLLHFFILGGYLFITPRLAWSVRSHTPGRVHRWAVTIVAVLPSVASLVLLSLGASAQALWVEPVTLVAVYATFLGYFASLWIRSAEVTGPGAVRTAVGRFPWFGTALLVVFLSLTCARFGLWGPGSTWIAMVLGTGLFLGVHLLCLLLGSHRLISLVGARQPSLVASEDLSRFSFSRRERDVAVLLLDGLTNAQIAARLFISERTVKNHVYNIYQKANVDSRVGLVNALRGFSSSTSD